MEIKVNTMKKVISTFLFLVIIISCKNKQEEEIKNIANEKKDSAIIISNKDICDIPQNILEYLNSSKDFSLLSKKDFNLINEYIRNIDCPISVIGDFNNNGQKDFAIIVRYNKYNNPIYKGYIFPFLLIFNDYEKGVDPYIIFKTGDYKNEDIKTVIYDQFNEGIFSYLKIGEVCEKVVLDIVIPEKSSFFIFWNSNNSKYEFLNYLDENLCEKISNNIIVKKNEINNLFRKLKFQYSINKIETKENISEQVITIEVIDKETNKAQQLIFYPKSLSQKFDLNTSNKSYYEPKKDNIITSEGIENYHQLISLDVNFDGLEDFAIVNDHGNGGPQYSYYIQKTDHQFELDEDLTQNMSYLPKEINNNEKTLTISQPSGCCKISTYKIQLQSNGKWKEVYSKLVDMK